MNGHKPFEDDVFPERLRSHAAILSDNSSVSRSNSTSSYHPVYLRLHTCILMYVCYDCCVAVSVKQRYKYTRVASTCMIHPYTRTFCGILLHAYVNMYMHIDIILARGIHVYIKMCVCIYIYIYIYIYIHTSLRLEKQQHKCDGRCLNVLPRATRWHMYIYTHFR